MKAQPKPKASAAAAANAAARRKTNIVELSVENEALIRSLVQVCGMSALHCAVTVSSLAPNTLFTVPPNSLSSFEYTQA